MCRCLPTAWEPRSAGSCSRVGAQLEGLAESAWKDIGLSRDNVLIGGNLLIYYEEGDPGKRVAPDMFVARTLSGGPLNALALGQVRRIAGVIDETPALHGR